jgi:hypothetical protein
MIFILLILFCLAMSAKERDLALVLLCFMVLFAMP